MVSKRGQQTGGKSVDDRMMAGADKFRRQMMQQVRGNDTTTIHRQECQRDAVMSTEAAAIVTAKVRVPSPHLLTAVVIDGDGGGMEPTAPMKASLMAEAVDGGGGNDVVAAAIDDNN